MRPNRFTRSPRLFDRAGVHLDNVALVPASLLPFKEQWQAIANGLPHGVMLIVLPSQAKSQRVALSVASQLRAKGQHVKVMGSEEHASPRHPGSSALLVKASLCSQGVGATDGSSPQQLAVITRLAEEPTSLTHGCRQPWPRGMTR